MDNSKARAAAAAVKRKLPPDAVLMQEYYMEGLSMAAIARRHGTHPTAVGQIFKNRGWTSSLPLDGSIPLLRELKSDARKVIVDTAAGRISIPRVPTIHGAFVGA